MTALRQIDIVSRGGISTGALKKTEGSVDQPKEGTVFLSLDWARFSAKWVFWNRW